MTVPLDETALQEARLGYRRKLTSEIVREIVSTYLHAAGFETEKRGEYQPHPKREGIRVHVDTEQRLVGPWVMCSNSK